MELPQKAARLFPDEYLTHKEQIMKTRILTTVSATALMAVSMPAVAQVNADSDPRWQYRSEMDDRQAGTMPRIGDTRRYGERAPVPPERDVFERSWDSTAAAPEYIWEDRSRLFDGRQPVVGESILLGAHNTAGSMLGKKIYNPQGQQLAMVEDIVIDRDGNARKIVLQEGGFLGLGGQTLAMDYKKLVSPGTEDRLMQSIDTESLRNAAAPFDYRPDSRAVPEDGLNVSRLLGGSLLNNRNEKVARIDNVTFERGRVGYAIVSFEHLLGMGGEQVALKFSDLQPVYGANGKVNLQMTQGQSEDFYIFIERNGLERRRF